MHRDVGERTGMSPSTRLLALVCVAVWVTAAASAGALGIWPAMGGAATVLGAAILVLDRAESRAILRPSPLLVLVGGAVGCAMAGATYLLYPLFTRAAPVLTDDTAFLYSAFRAPSLAVASLALAPIVLGEELVWRSVVQGALVRRVGRWGGVASAAAAYALALAPLRSPVLVLAALACGLCWGTLRAATRSLVPPLVAHLVWDVLVLLWLPLDSR